MLESLVTVYSVVEWFVCLNDPRAMSPGRATLAEKVEE